MMTESMSKISAGLAATLLLLGLIAGCDSGDPTTSAKSGGAESSQVTASAQGVEAGGAASQNPNADSDRYDVRSPEKAVSVGQKQTVELAITPGDGLKINKEFPWKLEFSPPKGVQLAQKRVSGDQIDLAESQATIPLHLEADAAGVHKLDATADFSVCNDTKCYVIRDQALSFDVKAEQAQTDQAGPEETGDSPE
jgi:hypothetical protein